MDQRFEKLYCSRWNIGFIEQPVAEIMTGAETEFDVKWVKHRLTDRFFADPFILSVEGGVIKVLVEEYFYNTKKGIITLLEVDAATYELRRRKVVLEQPYHQSFPYIHRDGDRIYVLPEASESAFIGMSMTQRVRSWSIGSWWLKSRCSTARLWSWMANGGCYAPSVANTATVDCLSLSLNGLKVRTRL